MAKRPSIALDRLHPDLSLEDLDEFLDVQQPAMSSEMASFGYVEGPKMGGKFRIEVFYDEYEFEDAHFNLTTPTNPPKMMAKIKLPELSFLLLPIDDSLEVMWTAPGFNVSRKKLEVISEWLKKETRVKNGKTTTNLESLINAWNEQVLSKSHGQISQRSKSPKKKK
jgi:hypothetical protein